MKTTFFKKTLSFLLVATFLLGGMTGTAQAADVCLDGHVFGDWVQETAPTCMTEGKDVATCINCSAKKYRQTRSHSVDDLIQVSNALPDNYFNGKSIVCVGDSITAGSGAKVGVTDYVTVLGNMLGATMTRKAEAGTVLCTGGHRTCNIYQLDSLPEKADVVTIYMGVNDWDHARNEEGAYYYDLGGPTDTDTATIYGAVRMWCERVMELKAQEAYQDTVFYFITPTITSWNLSMGNEKGDWDQTKTNIHGFTLRHICNVIMEVCASYNIPVLDLNLYSGLYYRSAEDNNAVSLYKDGIHPNASGHKMIAEAIAEFLLDNYRLEKREGADQGHSHVTIPAVAPDCSESGISDGKQCTICGELSVVPKTVPSEGHQYEATVTPPTCKAQGFTTHTCRACSDRFTDSYTDTVKHSYQNGACIWCDTDYPGIGIIENPQNASASLGEYYVVKVEAEGEGLTYAWFFRNAGFGDTFYPSSVTDNTYDDIMTERRAGREVYCVITDAYGNQVTTQTVTLNCVPSHTLQIVTQPQDATASLGEQYMVKVEAEGEGLTYAWFFRNAGSDTFYPSSVTDNTYDDIMTERRAGREVYCVITDAYGNQVTTQTVTLNCAPSRTLQIITQPQNTAASLGEQYMVKVEAEGEGLTYAWFFRNAGFDDTFYPSSVTDNTYDDIMTERRAGREVYCVITDAYGNQATTQTVTLNCAPSHTLQIVTQPQDATASLGEQYMVKVEAEGEGLTYAWFFRNAGSDTFYPSSVTDNTYDDIMTERRAGREVYCVITDAYGNQVTTQTAYLVLQK